MIRYFVNLTKLKEYAKIYKAKPLMKKILIAGIGTESDVMYKIFLGTNKTDPGFCLEVQNNKNELEETIVLKENWILQVKDTAEYYNNGLEDSNYYCTNPACLNFGEVDLPIRNQKGQNICPVCGCILSEKEPLCSIPYDRLLTIAGELIDYCAGQVEEVAYDMCEFLGIEEEEYDNIIANYVMEEELIMEE